MKGKKLVERTKSNFFLKKKVVLEMEKYTFAGHSKTSIGCEKGKMYLKIKVYVIYENKDG